MQRSAILLTSLLFLATCGVAGAAPTTDCSQPQDESEIVNGVSLALPDGRYFYLPTHEATSSATQKAVDKLGLWEESNDREGLQTELCVKYGVIRIFEADTYLGLPVA